MSRDAFYERVATTLEEIRTQGLEKVERQIISPQGATVEVAGVGPVLNLCANNYLGLADNAEIIAASQHSMETYGNGMASVRFICGTLDAHRLLER